MSTLPNPLSSLSNPAGSTFSTATASAPGGSATGLDQSIYGLLGLTGGQGQGILGAGLGTTTGGLAQTQSGVTAAAPALNYLTQLTQGNQASLTQAAQPEIDQISQQFDAVRNLISQQPRGGGKASALAEAPFQQATAVGNVEAGLQSQAASQLGNLSTQLAGVGLGEAGVGLGQEQVGTGLEQEAANIALGKQGLNYPQMEQLLSALL